MHKSRERRSLRNENGETIPEAFQHAYEGNQSYDGTQE